LADCITDSIAPTISHELSGTYLGSSVVFLLPSLKLKKPSTNGPSVENRLHDFLVENFGGYTAQAGNIFGYWREEHRQDSYGEHREFSGRRRRPIAPSAAKGIPGYNDAGA
jgi:hypothetical protein